VRANGQGESAAYYPYGEERTSAVDGREKFGTYFRDAIGQDYADQRYYGSGTGSFWSVDPGPANLANPATWNRYAYANGDPVNLYDPSGTMANCPPGTSPAGTGFNMYCAGSIDFTQLCLGMLGGNWYQWQFTNPDAAGYASAQLACQNNQAPPVTIGGPYDDGSGGSDTQQPCPPVPTLPGGNGAKEIQRNIKRAENYMMSVASTDFEGAGGAALPALMGYLAAQFAPRGSWDYKSRQPKGGNPYAQAMEFGNFNFGAVLAGLGFGITFTQSAAGIAQIGICLSGGSCGSGIPFFKFPYGDQAGDQAEIQAGYNYEQAVLAGCVH
jgi:RHS repeat-associated protein